MTRNNTIIDIQNTENIDLHKNIEHILKTNFVEDKKPKEPDQFKNIQDFLTNTNKLYNNYLMNIN